MFGWKFLKFTLEGCYENYRVERKILALVEYVLYERGKPRKILNIWQVAGLYWCIPNSTEDQWKIGGRPLSKLGLFLTSLRTNSICTLTTVGWGWIGGKITPCSQHHAKHKVKLADMNFCLWTSSIFQHFNEVMRFGNRLWYHLQARRGSNLVDPISKKTQPYRFELHTYAIF